MPASNPLLTLITPIRGRAGHVDVLLQWLERMRREEAWRDFELILVEGDRQPLHRERAAPYHWVRYRFVPMTGIFHKTVLLNIGLSMAQGAFVIPHDVDLLPAEGVMKLHLALARNSLLCLMSGYRLLLPEVPAHGDRLSNTLSLMTDLRSEAGGVLGPEENASALTKYLLNRERFGVNVCFPASLIRELGGWDEAYRGWGAEDQDMVERACRAGYTLVRAHDLIYFHMPHPAESLWHSASQRNENRERIRMKREEWNDTNDGISL